MKNQDQEEQPKATENMYVLRFFIQKNKYLEKNDFFKEGKKN